MTPTIRSGGASDIDDVLALWVESEAEPTHTDTAASLGTLLAHDPAALLVAEDGRRIVGSVIAGWDGWRGSIYRLVVAPSHRRRGLARLLTVRAEERLATVGAVRLQAIVVAKDAGATGFWDATDWELQAGRLRFVKG